MVQANTQVKDIKVLLVDDSPLELAVIKDMLVKSERFAFHISTCEDMKSAIDFVKSDSKVDIILLDLTLPDSQGFDTFGTMHAHAPETAIVVLTGLEDEDIAFRSVKEGAQDFLTKGDFDHRLLVRSIVYALERARVVKRLEQLTITDPLTGLLNRRGLQQVLMREIAWVRRGAESVAILIDLDNFKGINDNLGHATGDVVIKEIATRLRSTLRATDYISRIGGDEFMVLLPQTRSAEASIVAEKLRRAVSSTPMMIARETVKVTASMGVTRVSMETLSIDELLSKTHVALHKSKHSGKDQVIYSDDQQNVDKKYALTDLMNMLKNSESFRVVKHAIMDTQKNQLIGYEFLSRFCIEDFSNPDEFFQVCQENNLLSLVDHYCFKNCLKAALELDKKYQHHFNLFPSTLFNLNAENLLRDFPADVKERNFCIEISEQQIIGDPANLLDVLNPLREAGVLIAMDDIGFGRSNLESLIVLEPDQVKIDKKCIIGVSSNKGQLRSLERLVKLLLSQDVDIVAEGVETKEDLDIVSGLGIKLAQGFFWGKPA